MLNAEVAFNKKECKILKSEQDTIVDVANAQSADIQRYLKKETRVLDEIIEKQNQKQNFEYKRLHGQVSDVKNIVTELDAARMECVNKLIRVQNVLGIVTDSNEAFMQPLSSKINAYS